MSSKSADLPNETLATQRSSACQLCTEPGVSPQHPKYNITSNYSPPSLHIRKCGRQHVGRCLLCLASISLSLTLQWESDFPMMHHSCLLCVWLYTRLGWCGFRSGKQSVASTLTLMNVWRGAHSQARPMLQKIYSFYFFKIVCICVLCAYMCTCKHSTFRVHKKVSDPLIWSHKQWELETELGAAERAE